MTIEELFGTLQQSIVEEWRKHLKTSKYSKHEALDEFYKNMPEKVDKLIEDYIGHTKNKPEEYKNVLEAEDMNALQYMEALHELCTEGRSLLDGVTELESDLDDILGCIDGCMYKLRELKEGIEVNKNLSDFLKESINEARRLASFSDKELFIEFWDEWSGLKNGVGGINAPRCNKLANLLSKQFDYDVIDRILELDDAAREMTSGLDNGTSRIVIMKNAEKERPQVLALIDKNFEYLKTGKGSLEK